VATRPRAVVMLAFSAKRAPAAFLDPMRLIPGGHVRLTDALVATRSALSLASLCSFAGLAGFLAHCSKHRHGVSVRQDKVPKRQP
jgi:hypothetical protein